MSAKLKALFKKIDLLYNQVESKALTGQAAMIKIKELRAECLSAFEQGSDEFTQCIESLSDIQNLT